MQFKGLISDNYANYLINKQVLEKKNTQLFSALSPGKTCQLFQNACTDVLP